MFFSEKKYFLRLSGAAFIAIVALAMAAVMFFILLPHILTTTMVFVMLLVVFIIIWIIVYIAMVVGAAVYRYALPVHMKAAKTKESHAKG
jgi:uncharacterized membrane protein